MLDEQMGPNLFLLTQGKDVDRNRRTEVLRQTLKSFFGLLNVKPVGVIEYVQSTVNGLP